MTEAMAGDRFRVIVHDEEYDLTDFLPKHPGGADFLLWAKGRDCTIPCHIYHKDPERTVLPALKKYKVEKTDGASCIKAKLGIPHFLLPEKFNAETDIPKYDFDFKNDKLLLNTARKLILDKDVQAKIKHLDRAFDAIIMLNFALYLTLVVFWLLGYVPWWISVPSFAVLRTAIAGGGHYYIHQKRPQWRDSFFDINYVGMAFTAQDGHVLIHHMFTQSDADVKRGFFGGMMGVPRLFRWFAHTLHKLGHVTTGMFIRGFEVEIEHEGDEHQGVPRYNRKRFGQLATWSFWAMHSWLRIELFLAIHCGMGWSWLAQFCCVLWINTLMVVSSHDFTETFDSETKDWARYQLLNAHDMSIVGNPWIDCFLSAGLSPHRAHHVFPYQRSGFANVFSNKYLAQAAKKHDLPWLPPKKFITEIFPTVFKMYLWSPCADPIIRKPHYKSFWAEHTALAAYRYTAGYIFAGFLGIGSL